MKGQFSRKLISLAATVVLGVLFGATVVGFLDQARGVAARPHEAEAVHAVADLSITQTNNLTQVVPGTQVVYTLTLSNLSSEVVTNAVVIDASSPSYSLQGFSWRGTNAIVQSVTLTTGQPISFFATFGPGGFLNVVITGTLSPDATGTLTNTAKITAPADVTDPILSNNTATDADPIVASSNPMADVQISKTDGVTQVKTAQALSYTILVTNAGPMAVAGVQITDVLPSGYNATGVSFIYRRGSPPMLGLSTLGLLTATFDMLPGDVVTIVVNGLVKPAASMDLTNTAMVTLPTTMIDPDGANNIAIDVDALIVLPRTYLPLIRK